MTNEKNRNKLIELVCKYGGDHKLVNQAIVQGKGNSEIRSICWQWELRYLCFKKRSRRNPN